MNALKKHLLPFLLVLFVLSSCGGPLNKSIKEDLTAEELEQIMKSEKDFAYYYGYYIREGRSKLLSDFGETEWDKLTYNRLYKFYTKSYGSDASKKKEDEYRAEWQKTYDSYLPKIDSVDQYYQKVKEEGQLENYMNVELIDTDTPDYSSLLATVKVTPLKGTIEKARFQIGIRDKKVKGTGVHEKNEIEINTPFSEPVIVKKYVRAFSDEIAMRHNLGAEEFMNRMNFTAQLLDITKEGKVINWFSYADNIPREVKKLWEVQAKSKPADFEFEFAKVDIIQNMLGGTLKTSATYVNDKMQVVYSDFDDLAARFHKASY